MNKLTRRACATVLVFGALAAGPAAAAYRVGHIGGDHGSADIHGDSIVLHGSNVFNFWTSTTVIVTDTMSRAGKVTFNWAYYAGASASGDCAGYILNGVFTPLSNWSSRQQSGSTTVAFNAGDEFGFFVASDNDMGSPTLTITDAVYTHPPSAVPEPGSLVLVVAGLAGLPLLRRRRSGKRTAPPHSHPHPHPHLMRQEVRRPWC